MHNPVGFIDPSGMVARPTIPAVGVSALGVPFNIFGGFAPGFAAAANPALAAPKAAVVAVPTSVKIAAAVAFSPVTVAVGAAYVGWQVGTAIGNASSSNNASSSSYRDSSISASTPFTTPSIQGLAGLPEIALPNAVAQVTTNATVVGPQLPVGDWSANNVVLSSSQGAGGSLGSFGGLAGGGTGDPNDDRNWRNSNNNDGDLPSNARTTTNENEVFLRLERYHGISQHVASARLHAIKQSTGRGGNDNVLFDLTGNVFCPHTKKFIGSLTLP